MPFWWRKKRAMKEIAVLIPAYKPTRALIHLLHALSKTGIGRIVVVNDGSGTEFEAIFQEAENVSQVRLLRHKENQGKGEALKTGFRYLYEHEPHCEHVITADADGQHQPDDILKIAKEMIRLKKEAQRNEGLYMVLGIRDFSQKQVPFKSRFGNVITRNVYYYFTGEELQDTQTGLRGFPRELLPWLLTIEGSRYDYEMNMLALAKPQGIAIYQVPIKTIYEKGNPTSHFKPIKDSYYVYKIFFKFGASGLASYGLDIILFWFLCLIWRDDFPQLFIVIASIVSRVCSSFFNYFVNLHMVFGPGAPFPMVKYYLLALVVMLASAGATQGLYALIGGGEVLLKMMVDMMLFVASFFGQKKWVFYKRAK